MYADDTIIIEDDVLKMNQMKYSLPSTFEIRFKVYEVFLWNEDC